ncbi:Hypothetical predicted protein [Lecanosticta acicola]|uniref:Uncharacterized protein n=1 Tax=Lecanosticta acicola TaxID=111012 RepID=A0AAI9ECR0_9PEZI|nr:Hypothetical predicted protein [Lecanosticta acicola]
MARLRNATTAQQPTTEAPTRRAALKEKTNTSSAKIPVYENDGNTEGLVKDVKPKRGRPRKVQQNAEEFVMAGGLGPATSDAPVSAPNETAITTNELTKSDIAPAPVAKPNRRPQRIVKKIVQSEKQAQVLEGLKKRMEATAREKHTKQTIEPAPATSDIVLPSSDRTATKPSGSRKSKEPVERSEFSISPSPPPPGKLSTTKGKRTSMALAGSAMKVQNTPTVESSMMALKNFKRRPRQPSMLQMVQQRAASAQPSVANTAVFDTAAEDPSTFDLDLSTDEEDDFDPEAEGTPLNASKTTRLSSASTKQSASARVKAAEAKAKIESRKRKSDSVDVSSGAVNAPHAKKPRPAEDADDSDNIVVTPKPAAVPTSSARAETPQRVETSDIQVANSPSSTPPTEPSSVRQSVRAPQVEDSFVVPSTEREDEEDRTPTGVAYKAALDEPNGTMAEPISSSPAVMDAPQSTDIFADPNTQVSPGPLKSKPKRKQKQQHVATSMLQSLLPRRRQPLRPRERKSAYDMEADSDEDTPLDASHLEEDEDELGEDLRQPSKPKSSKTSRTTGGKPGRSKKSDTTTKKKTATAAAARKSSAAPRNKKGLRTYGRAPTISDKENDDYQSAGEDEEESTLPEISMSMQEAVQSKEIEDAKKKFAEVDQWDMEFESMSQEFHRSSSQEWR